MLPHEAHLHGVPEFFDWFDGPRIGMGLNPGEFTAMNAWGQAYEAATGNLAINTRIQIRDIAAYYLSTSDGEWHELQRSSSVDGEAYAEDFSDNEHSAADVRDEDSGGISVMLADGMNYHFWPEGGRVLLPPTEELGGIYTTVQARLVVDDPLDPEDLGDAQYLVGMGGDYWRTVDAQWVEGYENNQDIGIGRHRFVTPEWQSYNMTTQTLEELLAAPPPIP